MTNLLAYSGQISYQGKPLGQIKLNDDNTRKCVFVAESLDSLEKLFKLNPEDKVKTEVAGEIPYRALKEGLREISAFFSSDEQWLLRNTSKKTLREYNL